ncbi:MAG: hypothetical protein JST84_04170 [Acidobacteria bacterium]|nr:hypothetical protein [Acidobacteriota bacterium]
MEIAELFTKPEVYEQVLDQLRALPDIKNFGLGIKNKHHALDQIIALTWPKKPNEDLYKYQHVEFLLDQAADLLDRGVRDRTQWEDLYEKWFRNTLDIYELFEIDKIQKLEEAAGIFDVPVKLSESEHKANQKSLTNYNEAVNQLNNAVNEKFNDKERNLLVLWRAVLAICGVRPFHGSGMPDHPVIRSVGINGDTGEYALQLTTKLANNELAIQLCEKVAQKLLVQASQEAAQEKAAGLEKKAKYDVEDAKFKKMRRNVGTRIAAAKHLATILDGAPLNFISRMRPIQERYENDFSEALARIQVASQGIKLLYGYEEPLPQPTTDQGLHFFDDCLTWVRKAISFLVRFQRLDQSYVLSFSLKELCGNSWKKGRDAGVCKFTLDEKKHFPEQWSQQYVRLKGFSAFVLGQEAQKGIWQLVVKAPQSSYCMHRNSVKKDLDQTRAAPCLAGRVGNRNGMQPPDILGVVEFFNLSPFGKWQVDLPQQSLEKIDRSAIDDIHLDLHLVARVQL